jgi:hypothetical protein
MSTPPTKNVTHHERDPALEAAEKDHRFAVHDGEWKVIWGLGLAYPVAHKLKERIAGARECRTVTMVRMPEDEATREATLRLIAAAKPGPSAMPAVVRVIALYRDEFAAANRVERPAPAPVPTSPPLPPIVIDGRELPRQPPPAVVPPIVAAPPAPQPQPPSPPPQVGPTGSVCDACGSAIAAETPEVDGLRLCDPCKSGSELESAPLEDLVG